MMGMRRVSVTAWLVAVVLAGMLAQPVAVLPDSVGAQEVGSEALYGPQLYLLGPLPGRDTALARLPLTLHATIYGDSPERYIVSGAAELAVEAAAAGIPAQLLDSDTAGKAYYFVDAQSPGAADLAGRFGSILYADSLQILVAVNRIDESGMLESLPSQGARVALLPPEGLPLPQAAAAATPVPAALADTPSPLSDANPDIQVLLAQVDASEIYTRIAQLSGVEPISTAGGSLALSTRYTFAANVDSVEAAVLHQYAALGYAPSYSNWYYGSYSGRNVVADLPGVIHPERVWLIGGHFDDTSNTPYSYAPGADDNASGTAATLAIARILRGQRFADTIRFVGFGGEEQGMWGSKSYAQALLNGGVQVMGYIDLDMIGWDSDDDRTVEIHSGTGINSIALAQRFVDANVRYGQGLRVEVKQTTASRFSDHSSFWDRFFPAFLAIENFYDDTLPRDRNPYYHNTGDTLSRVDLDYVTRTTRTSLAMLAEAAVLITGTPPTPPPTPPPPSGTCTELVLNGGFEADSAWSFGPTANRAGYTTAQRYTGTRSVRMGIDGTAGAALTDGGIIRRPQVGGERNLLGELAPEGASYSSVYQTISVPANATSVTLSFWRRPGSQGATGDFQRGLLLMPGTYTVITTIFNDLVTTDWQRMTFDLTPYRGQSVVVYFEVYNDDITASPLVWMYLDDVSARAWSGTPTPSPIATTDWAYHTWLPMLFYAGEQPCGQP